MCPHRSEFNTYIRPQPPKHLPEDERSFSRNIARLKNMIQDKTNCSSESIQHTELTNLIIFRIIQQQYGETIFHKCRTLEKKRLKYARYTNHLCFSLPCHHNNLIPNDLYLKSKLKTPKSKQILERASHQLLQERIHINHNRRNRIKIPLDEQTDHIQSILQPEHYNQLVTYHNNTYENETKKSEKPPSKEI